MLSPRSSAYSAYGRPISRSEMASQGRLLQGSGPYSTPWSEPDYFVDSQYPDSYFPQPYAQPFDDYSPRDWATSMTGRLPYTLPPSLSRPRGVYDPLMDSLPTTYPSHYDRVPSYVPPVRNSVSPVGSYVPPEYSVHDPYPGTYSPYYPPPQRGNIPSYVPPARTSVSPVSSYVPPEYPVGDHYPGSYSPHYPGSYSPHYPSMIKSPSPSELQPRVVPPTSRTYSPPSALPSGYSTRYPSSYQTDYMPVNSFVSPGTVPTYSPSHQSAAPMPSFTNPSNNASFQRGYSNAVPQGRAAPGGGHPLPPGHPMAAPRRRRGMCGC